MSKMILFDQKAKEKLKAGVDQLANAVKVTLGPKGRNVVIEKSYGAPIITKDGVTVAKEIELEDKFENIGAELVKEAASKTSDVAGDGTTTATVLAQAMITQGLKYASSGHNPVDVKKGMDKAVEVLVGELKKMSQECKTAEMITRVASISANDKEIGELIAQAMKEVGNEGVITVEESQSFGLSTEVVKGMQFDKGYISAYMMNNAEKLLAEFTDALILITDKKISSIQDILPLLEKLAATGKKELVIIADDLDGEALSTLVVNKLRGAFSALAVKAPGFGDRKKLMLQDIAILTGGTVISDEVGLSLDKLEIEHLGRAAKVIATKDNTTIVEGRGDTKLVEAHVASLRNELELTDSTFDKEKLQERIAKLAGGVAVIKVGAASEMEMKEIKDRIDDALHATRAAVEEGIVVGGGVALIRAADALDNVKIANVSEEIGVKIIAEAIEAPLKQISINAGKSGEVVLENVKKMKGNEGYNAADDKYEDLVAKGVIDPTKVTRMALQNATSVSSMFLTMEAVIANKPEKKKEDPMPGNMGGGMGY